MKTDKIIVRAFILEHSREAARVLNRLDPEKLAVFFNESSPELLQKLIPQLNPHLVSGVFEFMQKEQLFRLFDSWEAQHILFSVRLMNDDLAEEVLHTLSAETSSTIKLMLKYLQHTVGSHIDLTALTLTGNMTVKEALEETKRNKEQVRPNLFVLSSEKKLVGVVNLQDLISEKPGREIQSIMNTNITTLHPDTPIQSILTRREWNEFYSLPVVDKDSVFLGVIKLETVRSLLATKRKEKEDSSEDAISALGELYHIGLAGLLNSAAELRSKQE